MCEARTVALHAHRASLWIQVGAPQGNGVGTLEILDHVLLGEVLYVPFHDSTTCIGQTRTKGHRREVWSDGPEKAR